MRCPPLFAYVRIQSRGRRWPGLWLPIGLLWLPLLILLLPIIALACVVLPLIDRTAGKAFGPLCASCLDFFCALRGLAVEATGRDHSFEVRMC